MNQADCRRISRIQQRSPCWSASIGANLAIPRSIRSCACRIQGNIAASKQPIATSPMQNVLRILAFLCLTTAATRPNATRAQANGRVMTAVVAHQYGGAEVLKHEKVPIPEPKENEAFGARDRRGCESRRSADRVGKIREGIRDSFAAHSRLRHCRRGGKNGRTGCDTKSGRCGLRLPVDGG